jgi:hypothetical protein
MPRGRPRKYPLPQPGQRFHRLTILEAVPVPPRWRGTYNAKYHWYHCLCVCGTPRVVNDNSLNTGNTKSCGCLQRDAIQRIGRMHSTPRAAPVPEMV